jgi:hypothetical protein
MIDGSVCISPEVGTLTINSVSLNTPAWGILDLSELWASQPPLRGTNVVLPGATGQRPYPRRFNEAKWALHMVISGVCDQTGAPYADEETGLQTNIGYLLANVVDPPTPPAATRAASLLLPDGTTTRTANVQVTGFDRGAKNHGLMRAVLELTIPGGMFT